MGAKLQSEIGARNKLNIIIHFNRQRVVASLHVKLEEVRRLVDTRSPQIRIQITLAWKNQMLEEMLIGLVQLKKQWAQNLTELKEKSIPLCLKGKRSPHRGREVLQPRLTSPTS